MKDAFERVAVGGTVRLSAFDDFVTVESGNGWFMALKSDGTVVTWNLGSHYVPVAPAGLKVKFPLPLVGRFVTVEGNGNLLLLEKQRQVQPSDAATNHTNARHFVLVLLLAAS